MGSSFAESGDARLVGARRCTGRLEVEHQREWRPVHPWNWNHQASSVVCRMLGCGSAVSAEWIRGSEDRPAWVIGHFCVGSESLLGECGEGMRRFSPIYSNSSETCSYSLELTCSEPDVRLVGGARRCAGRVEVKHQREWRPLDPWNELWNHHTSSVVCRQLGCGSAVSTGKIRGSTYQPTWLTQSNCNGSESLLRECEKLMLTYSTSYWSLELFCSGSVRLVNGSSQCSGRVEVKSDQSWVSVCEGDFDQQDAEVVCRQLACGAPAVLQGALYGEGSAPMWTKEFQCKGNESDLLDCRRSDSTRNTTCSPGKTVELTCSEPVRLVGGDNSCAGRVEMKFQDEWRPVVRFNWNHQSSSVVCRQLGCGAAVSEKLIDEGMDEPMWWLGSNCVGSESLLRECGIMSSTTLKKFETLICSGSKTDFSDTTPQVNLTVHTAV